MTQFDRRARARRFYEAFANGDRELVEDLISDDFQFHAPPDPDLDRDGYFERCWPHAGGGDIFEFERLVEIGDEVLVTYESDKPDGRRIRNTEVIIFDGDRIAVAEV